MIGLYHLHKQQMDEACAEWCKAAKTMLDDDCYVYKLKNEKGKVVGEFKFKTFKDKVIGVSRLKLNHSGLSGTNLEIANDLLEDELNLVFTDFEAYVGYDVDKIKQVANKCKKNLEHTALYHYVYQALKEPFEDFYTKMQKKMQYDTFKKLGIRTCPYCNRQYTFTLRPKEKGDPFTSPEFDHFYPKSLYPTLAVSFYNRVPSCHCCNHGKGTKQLHINPYDYRFQGGFYLQDEQGNRMNTNDILSIKDEANIYVGYDGPFEEREDVKTLGLDQLYSMHSDYVQEIIDKVNAYNRASREGLADSFQGIFHTPEQVYDFVWGRHLELAEQEKRPLSKFTKDLLEQMGVKR